MPSVIRIIVFTANGRIFVPVSTLMPSSRPAEIAVLPFTGLLLRFVIFVANRRVVGHQIGVDLRNLVRVAALGGVARVAHQRDVLVLNRRVEFDQETRRPTSPARPSGSASDAACRIPWCPSDS